jgi:hypothetical protein
LPPSQRSLRQGREVTLSPLQGAQKRPCSGGISYSLASSVGRGAGRPTGRPGDAPCECHRDRDLQLSACATGTAFKLVLVDSDLQACCQWTLPMDSDLASGPCQWTLPVDLASGPCQWTLPVDLASGLCQWTECNGTAAAALAATDSLSPSQSRSQWN